jgi:hypothetical protein
MQGRACVDVLQHVSGWKNGLQYLALTVKRRLMKKDSNVHVDPVI